MASWRCTEHGYVLGLNGGEPKRRRRQVRRRLGLGLDGNEGYDELMDMGEGGIGRGAHGECRGGLGVLGEAPERAGRREGSPAVRG